MAAIANRYDFVFLFDVTNGNPNGDPDAGNLPRLDPETNFGLVTDVSLKRKIRNYAELAHDGAPPWRIYVTEGAILNDKHREAYAAIRGEAAAPEKGGKGGGKEKLNPRDDAEAKRIRDWMCANFFDVRSFGAVMSTGVNAGQVRGPVQLSFARSVEAVMPLEISITRMAATNEAEKKKRDEASEGDDRQDNRTMGRKHIIPYGLYRAHGFVSAKLAERTGFSEDDLAFLWRALADMFDHDRSAARGEMAARSLTVFRHQSALGNAHAHQLFDRVEVRRRSGEDWYALDDRRLGNAPPARRFADYRVEVDEEKLPEGVEILRLI